MQKQFAEGLRAKVLLTPDGRQCGYIEYLPGEDAWRGVEAGGFETVDAAQPDYELMVLKFRRWAELPKFKGEWDRKLESFGKGLTIVRSDQCPHIAKFAGEIAGLAENEFGIKPRIVRVENG